MGQRVPAYRLPERARRPVARTPCAHSKRQPPESSSTEAPVAIPYPYATIAMVTWVGPFWANTWVQFSVPKFTGTPELALGPRPPNTTLTRWLYDELRRAMLTGRLKRGTRLPATRDLLDSMGYRAAWWSTSSSSCEPKDTW